MADAINIIIDKSSPPYPQSNYPLIEIKTDDGQSISIGERIEDRGFIKIRITADNIKNIFKEYDQRRRQ